MDWNKLFEIFGDCELNNGKVWVKSKFHDVIRYAADNFSFDILKEIVAIHNPDGLVELDYHLYSTINEEDLILAIFVKDEAETVTDIFESAVADENEIFDLFGVKFAGNENLKRLYMPEDWDGHPLRKDYVQDDTRLAWNDDKDNV